MKKLLWIIPIVLLFSCNYSNSDVLNFKVEYKPDCVYKQTMTDKTQTETKYDATPEVLQTLKDKGIQNPSKLNNNISVLITLKTGKLGPQNIYPFTMNYIKTESKDGKKEIPDNTFFYGTDTLGRVPMIDSVSPLPDMTADAKKKLVSAVQDMLQESCGPEKKLKVGEQFTREAPMNVDMGFTKLRMTVTSTYSLKNIANNVATFEITQVYALNSTIKNHTFKADGVGKGNIVYDISDNYYKDYAINMTLNMSMDNGGIFANIKTDSNIDIQTSLVQN